MFPFDDVIMDVHILSDMLYGYLLFEAVASFSHVFLFHQLLDSFKNSDATK